MHASLQGGLQVLLRFVTRVRVRSWSGGIHCQLDVRRRGGSTRSPRNTDVRLEEVADHNRRATHCSHASASAEVNPLSRSVTR